MWPFSRKSRPAASKDMPVSGNGNSNGNAGNNGGNGNGGNGNGGKSKKGTASLSDLARGLQHAAASTGLMMAEQYLEILDQFFERGPANTYRPKLVRILTPDGQLAQVPLFTLIEPKSIGLNRMRVGVKATVEDIRRFRQEGTQFDSSRTAFTVSISEKEPRGKQSSSDLLDVELEFTAGEPPETVSRLIEQFTHQVRVIDPVNPTNGSGSGNGGPPAQGGGSPSQGGGAPPQGGGYPPQGAGVPPQGGGYPPQGAGVPPQGGGYPPQDAGVPPQGGGYPPQNQGYPPQGGVSQPHNSGNN